MGWIRCTGGGGGGDTKQTAVTQAEYDALVQAGTVDPTMEYFITDGIPSSVEYYHNYSTDEQIVGTWIDGRPVYEKTFEITSPSTGYYSNAHNISNFDMVISVIGSLKKTNGVSDPVGWLTAAGNYNNTVVDFDSTKYYLNIGNQMIGNDSITKLWFTVRYTKSSS